jgi:ABC-type multidrug transport system ATPase subunit
MYQEKSYGQLTLPPMNIITDNLNLDSEDIIYNDVDIRKQGRDYRYLLGYMSQQQGLYGNFTLNRFL